MDKRNAARVGRVGGGHDGRAATAMVPGRVARGTIAQPKLAVPGRTTAVAAAAPRPSGPGAALAAPVRAQMERALGASFATVRVHEDGQAAAIGARALARGEDVFFAPGQYDPSTTEGAQLLAHELAHVVQQRQGRARGGDSAGGEAEWLMDDPALEAEADAAAAKVTAIPVAREPAPGTSAPTAAPAAATSAAVVQPKLRDAKGRKANRDTTRGAFTETDPTSIYFNFPFTVVENLGRGDLLVESDLLGRFTYNVDSGKYTAMGRGSSRRGGDDRDRDRERKTEKKSEKKSERKTEEQTDNKRKRQRSESMNYESSSSGELTDDDEYSFRSEEGSDDVDVDFEDDSDASSEGDKEEAPAKQRETKARKQKGPSTKKLRKEAADSDDAAKPTKTKAKRKKAAPPPKRENLDLDGRLDKKSAALLQRIVDAKDGKDDGAAAEPEPKRVLWPSDDYESGSESDDSDFEGEQDDHDEPDLGLDDMIESEPAPSAESAPKRTRHRDPLRSSPTQTTMREHQSALVARRRAPTPKDVELRRSLQIYWRYLADRIAFLEVELERLGLQPASSSSSSSPEPNDRKEMDAEIAQLRLEQKALGPTHKYFESVDDAEVRAYSRRLIQDPKTAHDGAPKVFVRQSRGIHYARANFTKGERRKHRATSEIGLPVFSSAAYELLNFQLAKHKIRPVHPSDPRLDRHGKRFDPDLYALLEAVAQRIRDRVLGLRDKPGDDAPVSETHRKQLGLGYRTLADAHQTVYSNSYASYHRDAEAIVAKEKPKDRRMAAIYDELFGTGSKHPEAKWSTNPLVSTGDEAAHPQRYSLGDKPPRGYNPRTQREYKAERLRPRYNNAGNKDPHPRRPYSGKTYLSLHPAEEMFGPRAPSHVTRQQADFDTDVGFRIFKETESSFAGLLESDRVVFHQNAKFPSFVGDYDPAYKLKYGIDAATYKKYQAVFTTGGVQGDEAVKAAKSSLVQEVLAPHNAKRADEEADLQAARMGGVARSRDLAGGLSRDAADPTTAYRQRDGFVERAFAAKEVAALNKEGKHKPSKKTRKKLEASLQQRADRLGIKRERLIAEVTDQTPQTLWEAHLRRGVPRRADKGRRDVPKPEDVLPDAVLAELLQEKRGTLTQQSGAFYPFRDYTMPTPARGRSGGDGPDPGGDDDGEDRMDEDKDKDKDKGKDKRDRDGRDDRSNSSRGGDPSGRRDDKREDKGGDGSREQRTRGAAQLSRELRDLACDAFWADPDIKTAKLAPEMFRSFRFAVIDRIRVLCKDDAAAGVERIRAQFLDELPGHVGHAKKVKQELGIPEGFEVKRVQARGDCLFDSVSQLLGGATPVETLRKNAAQHIRKHPAEFTWAVPGMLGSEIADFVEKQGNWDALPGNVAPMALAQSANITLVVHSHLYHQPQEVNPGQTHYVHVLYSGKHYDALVPKPLRQDDIVMQ
jgi:hypothetical protein